MDLFIKRLIVCIVALGFIFLAALIVTNNIIADGKYFSIPTAKSSVILGHSQSECGFNDSLIEGFYNLSQSGEGYPYSYFKAKKILENNNHIDHIFIVYTNNQIDPWAENRISGIYLDVNILRTFPVISKTFTLKTFYNSKNIKNIFSSIVYTLRRNLNFLLGNNNNYIEAIWHENNTPTNIFKGDPSIAKDISVSKKNFKDIYSIERENLQYLFKLKSLCTEYGVKLFFIRTPFIAKNAYNEVVFNDILKTFFPEVEFLDFRDYPLLSNQFADEDHLNINGQNELSKFFNNEIVKKGVLNEENVGWLVKQKINEVRTHNNVNRK